MNPKLLRRLLVGVVAVGAFAGLYYYTHAPLLRIRLPDGTEIRVLKVAYGTGANHEHEIIAPSAVKLRLIRLLPQSWQGYFNPPIQQAPFLPNTLPSLSRKLRSEEHFPKPMLFVWWVYDPPLTPGIAAQPALVRVPKDSSDLLGIYQTFPAPGTPSRLTYYLGPEPPTTFPVHFSVNGQSVDFTVSFPPRAPSP